MNGSLYCFNLPYKEKWFSNTQYAGTLDKYNKCKLKKIYKCIFSILLIKEHRVY